MEDDDDRGGGKETRVHQDVILAPGPGELRNQEVLSRRTE